MLLRKKLVGLLLSLALLLLVVLIRPAGPANAALPLPVSS
jgi:hypothetical protein